ncbi:metalloprotease MEP2 [Auriculariales sp. MPI-PUGE-AT-0066]|nr:metalloprotease MEP2 [Auriculariales sp. MPI-PUGE-AT-0066]
MKTSVGFYTVALLAACGELTLGFAPNQARHSTHRVRSLRNGRRAVAFQKESTYETFGEGLEHGDLSRRAGDVKPLGISYLESRLGSDYVVTSSYDAEKASYVYIQQTINGIPVVNAVANVAVNKGGKIAAFGSSFSTGASSRLAAAQPKLTVEEAIAQAEEQLGGQWDGTESKLVYVNLDDGSHVLSRSVQLWEDNGNGHLLQGFVNAQTGDVVMVNDFTTSVSYLTLPLNKISPLLGFGLATDPADLTASPSGWHTIPGGTAANSTQGNNVISYKSSTTGVTSESSSGTYSYIWSSASAPSATPNVHVARTNAFYIANLVHDISYRYGFTETAFNFQQNNRGLGGAQNDRVQISVQDSAGTNNADFTTPADGSSGRMRMYQWTYTTVRRDGALENDIVIHEYTHGITNRMTGGGTGACLQTTEAGGMGEGWSDAMAEWTWQTGPTIVNFVLGAYVINSSAGIRSYPYSTSNSTNPLTYGSLKTLTEVHDVGEVWANILHNVHAALVTSHGWSSDAKTNPAATGGNAVFLHLFIDALALQACNPTLPTARDAWIQADANRYAGANKCTLWTAFASRGLGSAAASHTNSYTVPSGC